MKKENKIIPKLKLSSKANMEINRDIVNTERANKVQTLPIINKKINDESSELFYLTNNPKNNYYTSRSNGKDSTENYNKTIQANKSGVPTSKNKVSAVEKQKALFNKLYGLSNSYLKRYKQAQHSKDLPLEEYQNNLLRVLASNQIDQNNFININSKFREIRLDTQRITPLPLFNIEDVHRYVKMKNDINNKKQTLGEYLSVTTLKNKIFEKEFEGNKLKYMSKPKPKRNKVFNLLPLHLVEAMETKMKFHL